MTPQAARPPSGKLPLRTRSSSAIVNQGMQRVCKDFSSRIASSDFRKAGRRLWARINACTAESIHFHRGGSSYGAPINASVHIRVTLGIHVLNDLEPGYGISINSDQIRRPNGYAYHYRFNAQT